MRAADSVAKRGWPLAARESLDIANAVLFLAWNPFSTGSIVVVDGGATIAP